MTVVTNSNYFSYLKNSGIEIAKKCFRYSIDKLQKIQLLISQVGNQKNLSEDLSLYAISYLVKNAKSPLSKERNFSAFEFLEDADPHYYRSEGGSILKLYYEIIKSKNYSFLFNSQDTFELIKGDKFRHFLKFKYNVIRIGSSKNKTSNLSDRDAQLKFLENFRSTQNGDRKTFIDISNLLSANKATDLEKRISQIKSVIKNNPELQNVIIGGFIKLEDGQDAYILLNDLKTKDQIKLNAHDIHDIRMATGYMPDMIQIRKNVLKNNVSLKDFESLIPSTIRGQIQKPACALEGCELTEKVSSVLQTLTTKRSSTKEPVEKYYFSIFENFLQALAPSLTNSSLNPLEKTVALFALSEMEHILSSISPSDKNYLAFLGEVDLLMEEFTCLLTVVKPTQPLTEVLNQIGVCFKSEDGASKKSYFFTSGMNAISHILGGLRKQYSSNENSQSRPKLGFTANSYFETRFYLQPNVSTVFDSSTAGDPLEDVDIFFMDIYPNAPTSNKVKKLDPITTISTLLSLRQGKPLTVVIDASTMQFDSQDIQKIVDDPQIRKAIHAGLLNLVVVSSLAKFAMAGLDKYSGGVIQTYNKDQAFKPFNNLLIKRQAQEQPSSEAENFFSLFFTHGQEKLTQYIETINANTNQVYKDLKKNLPQAILSPAERDDNIPMINFTMKPVMNAIKESKNVADTTKIEMKLAILLNHYFYGLAKKMGLPIDIRPSFGFAHSSINPAATSLRFTVGLENEQILKRYVEIFVKINQELEKAIKDPKFVSILFQTSKPIFKTEEKRLQTLEKMTEKTSLTEFMEI